MTIYIIDMTRSYHLSEKTRKIPEGHVVLVLTTSQCRQKVLLDRLVLLVPAQQDISGVEGLVAGLEPPDVEELVLVTDEDVEVSGGPAAELQTGSDVVVEELAKPLVSLEVAVDGPALDVVHLQLHDLLPRGQSLGVRSVLNLNCPGLKKAPEESGLLAGAVPVTRSRSRRGSRAGKAPLVQGLDETPEGLLQDRRVLHRAGKKMSPTFLDFGEGQKIAIVSCQLFFSVPCYSFEVDRSY